MDVPNEINDDSFWAEFREVVKTANPQAYLVGEIWAPDQRWVGDGHFDGLMNYPIMDALVGLLATNSIDANRFAEKVEGLLSFYPRENTYAMYNPLSTHDTERILTHMGNNEEKTRLAYLFQFAYPGAPAIYYGDEIGLVGGKDPACRGAFLWERPSWNRGLHTFIKDLVRLRIEHVALRRGEYVRIPVEASTTIYAFLRTAQEDKVLVIMNASGTAADFNINVERCGWQDGQMIKDLLSPERVFSVTNRSLTIRLPAWNGLWLC